MSFVRFQYFLTLAEELSFQKAAEKLFISQQALSMRIQNMETEFGVRLFDRRPRVRLTLAGERMVLHVKRLMETKDSMISDLSDLARHISGKIRVGISGLRGYIFFPIIWERFHSLYPYVNISIIDTTNYNMGTRLILGEVDLYIGVTTTQETQLQGIPLVKEPLCCVVHRSVLEQLGISDLDHILHLATHHFDIKEFLRLANFPYVMLAAPNRIRATIDRFLYDNKIIPNVAFECVNHIVVWEICKRGGGVGLISPAILYQEKTYDKNLCIFPIYEETLASEVKIVYLKTNKLPAYCGDLIQLTKNVFTEYSNKSFRTERPWSIDMITDLE